MSGLYPHAYASQDLNALGALFEEAWMLEKAVCALVGDRNDVAADEMVDKAIDVTGAVVKVIMDTPAFDLAGMRLKARAYLWCHGGDADHLTPAEAYTDGQLAASIVRDLLNLGDRA